jgi:hypothetical protein
MSGHPGPHLRLPEHLVTLRRRSIAAVVAAGAAVGAGAWALADHFTGTPPATVASVPGAMEPTAANAFAAAALQRQLVAAGYDIGVTGVLDPVAKSAAADFLSVVPVGLETAMRKTVIIGRADPAAWNRRFGTHRWARMAARPLLGPGGQLDDYGNIR